ncbi:hypothetical protein [Peribacillus deserti]
MFLENDYFVKMNHKKIRRLMRKYQLFFTKVRKASLIKKWQKLPYNTVHALTC